MTGAKAELKKRTGTRVEFAARSSGIGERDSYGSCECDGEGRPSKSLVTALKGFNRLSGACLSLMRMLLV